MGSDGERGGGEGDRAGRRGLACLLLPSRVLTQRPLQFSLPLSRFSWTPHPLRAPSVQARETHCLLLLVAVVAAILIPPFKRTLQSRQRQTLLRKSRQRQTLLRKSRQSRTQQQQQSKSRTQQSKSRQSRTNRKASAGKRAYKLREAQGKIKGTKPAKRKSRKSKQVTHPLSLITSSLPSLDIAGEETLQRAQVQTRHAQTVS